MTLGDGVLDPITNHRANGVDPYGPNPLFEALRSNSPAAVNGALRGGPAPEMFFGGPLPAFTASGIDPQTLMQFPWNQRHWAAATPDRGAVFKALTEHGSDPDTTLACEGYEAFVGAMRYWAINSKKTETVDADTVWRDVGGEAFDAHYGF